VQLALICAQAGTATGLGGADGEGVGDGLGPALGVGVAEAVADGLEEGLDDGLECATAGPFAVQPAAAIRAHASTNPILTSD